jgi:starvation-inducible DNA-binding protein
MDEELIQSLKTTLAETFAFYLKAHYYHWNVEGPDFAQYHEFLGDLYEEVHGAIDPMAEYIRTLGAYAPGSFARYMELSTIEGEDIVPEASQMLSNLLSDTVIMLASIKRSRDLADAAGETGLANFLDERDAAHKKHRWMIRAFLKPYDN